MLSDRFASDALHGTPVPDLEPVLRKFLPRQTVEKPAWTTALMQDYWLAPKSRRSR